MEEEGHTHTQVQKVDGTGQLLLELEGAGRDVCAKGKVGDCDEEEEKEKGNESTSGSGCESSSGSGCHADESGEEIGAGSSAAEESSASTERVESDSTEKGSGAKVLTDVLAQSDEQAGMDGFLGMMGSPFKKPKLGEGVSVEEMAREMGWF